MNTFAFWFRTIKDPCNTVGNVRHGYYFVIKVNRDLDIHRLNEQIQTGQALIFN